MLDKLRTFGQYLLPQHLITRLFGYIAECRCSCLKNFYIKTFIKRYQVNMTEALQENPEAYTNFNDFFIRELKPELRPIIQDKDTLISPVDGCISQLSFIDKQQLVQAKGFHFTLTSLLGGDNLLATSFDEGAYTTLYLAPRDYHRIHMPLAGKLIKTIYVPGKLFSVNQITAENIPQLYSRNERLICIFATEAGQMAVILVGAMIVGSIKTVWMNTPIRCSKLATTSFSDGPELLKGAELGYFKLGSTVILLFEKDRIEWASHLNLTNFVKMGQALASFKLLLS